VRGLRGIAGVLALTATGCASMGQKVVGGALDELERRGGTASLTRNAVIGARDELTSAESRDKLVALQAAMMEQMTLDAARLRQELLGEAFRADVERARAEFLDKSRADLRLMRDELLGDRTHDAAGRIADRITGEVTRAHFALIRDELLGERSREMAQLLVQQAGQSMQIQVEKLRLQLEGEKQALKDELKRTLWLSGIAIAGLAAALVGTIFVAHRRHRIIAALTEPIQGMSDMREYRELTHRIADRARELGVSAMVRFVDRDRGDRKES
jgi:hypothetical protein